ncbi:multidrug resistance protein 1 [Purpureocillium lavendulum]|uniref:Multidrug resistance protein 1 n=1 Tax=Purpureocillium lavendulum TaxID=1247861 RepID=A0AB34G3N9_9HYPO|nr:multidrug resistance protein 1 [Purpureocillium lavendulum]
MLSLQPLLIALAGLSAAAVVPQDVRRHDVVAPTMASLPVQTQSARGPPQPAAVTPTVSLPVACDYTYCDGSSSWCFYWGGVTSYDMSRGPVPGETRIKLGPCGATVTSTAAATRQPRHT